MKRVLFYVSLAFLFCIIGAIYTPYARGQDPAPIQVPADTVRVVAVDGAAMCSAVVIAPDTALTARHCLRQGMTVDGKAADYVTANGAKDGDIGLVVAPGLACPCAALGGLPAKGDTVVAVGFPSELQGKQRASEPVKVKLVGAYKEAAPWFGDNFTAVFIFTEKAILDHGDSGGGLFALQGGAWKLVGIGAVGVPERPKLHPFDQVPENASGFTPLDAARKFLPKT